MSVHSPSPKRLHLATLVAGSFLLLTPVSLSAGDLSCGCESACDMMPPEAPPCGCDSAACRVGRGMKKTLLFKALDSVAGGIEKVLHLDKGRCGCDAMVCDDGCDAAMMGELLVPMPPASHSFHHSEPMNSAALEQWQQTPPVVAPRTQMRMSQPRMAPQSGRAIPQAQPEPQATGEPSQRSMPAQRSTPAQRSEPVQRSMPSQGVPAPPIPEDESDSLFDALSNPFSDDEVHVRRFNPVRPSNYQRDSNLPKETLSRSHQTSSRRVRRSQ